MAPRCLGASIPLTEIVALIENLVKHAGFSAFTVIGHNRARYFNPANGGILFNSPLPTGVFRIDHDQKFPSTFSRTHFVPSRTFQAEVKWVF